MPELRPEWICDECGVRCYKMTGEPFPAPEGWVRDRCMTCARDQETPIESARRQVLEGKKNSRIMVKGVKAATLDQIRAEAIEAGDLDPDAAKSKPDPNAINEADRAKVPAVEEALKADPSRTNQALGGELGVRTKTVATVRKRLGLPDANTAAKQKRGEEIRQALRDHPDLSDAEIGRLLGLAKNTVGAARRKARRDWSSSSTAPPSRSTAATRT